MADYLKIRLWSHGRTGRIAKNYFEGDSVLSTTNSSGRSTRLNALDTQARTAAPCLAPVHAPPPVATYLRTRPHCAPVALPLRSRCPLISPVLRSDFAPLRIHCAPIALRSHRVLFEL